MVKVMTWNRGKRIEINPIDDACDKRFYKINILEYNPEIYSKFTTNDEVSKYIKLVSNCGNGLYDFSTGMFLSPEEWIIKDKIQEYFEAYYYELINIFEVDSFVSYTNKHFFQVGNRYYRK